MKSSGFKKINKRNIIKRSSLFADVFVTFMWRGGGSSQNWLLSMVLTVLYGARVLKRKSKEKYGVNFYGKSILIGYKVQIVVHIVKIGINY